MLSACVESHVEWCRTPGMDAGLGAVHQGRFAKPDSERNQYGVAFSLVTFSCATSRESYSRESAKALCRAVGTMRP